MKYHQLVSGHSYRRRTNPKQCISLNLYRDATHRAINVVIEIQAHVLRTPKMYTTTGCGPRKNREMAGVDHLVVYLQTAVKYNTFYIHHPGGAKWPRGGVYTNCCILQQFAYTPNGPHQPFPFFFLGSHPVVVYIFGVRMCCRVRCICSSSL